MIISIRFADAYSIPRIAQLTQKTNQFNMTTRRYTEDDIKKFSISPDSDVIYLRLEDRFGDSGIVGSCILKFKSGKTWIDTLLLSCRVLGRCIEEVFLAEIVRFSKMRQCAEIIGEYIPTKKNRLAEEFYVRCGFEIVQEDTEKSIFSYLLHKVVPSKFSFFKEVQSEICEMKELKEC